MSARDQRAKVDIKIYENGSYRKTFQWKVSGVPVDITGYSGLMQIREKLTSSSPILTLTTANGGVTIVDSTNGIFAITIKDEVSASICAEHKDIKGVYDLKLSGPDQPTDDGTMLLYGECYIVAAVSRS
jgi:hypothetical protein